MGSDTPRLVALDSTRKQVEQPSMTSAPATAFSFLSCLSCCPGFLMWKCESNNHFPPQAAFGHSV